MGGRHQPYELALYAKRIHEHRILSLEEELELARQYRNGNTEAGQQIINANLRLALKISRPYFYHGHNPLEIVQEGNLGLVRALALFNPDRGIKFFGYAVWWVHAYIRNFIYKNSRSTLGFAANLMSLDTALPDRENTEECYKDHLSDDSPDQEEEYFSKQKQLLIARVLCDEDGPLNTREKYILKRRFFEEPKPTLSQLGKKMKISKERIRQIENISLEKIRIHMRTIYPLAKKDLIETYRRQPSGKELFTMLRAEG